MSLSHAWRQKYGVTVPLSQSRTGGHSVICFVFGTTAELIKIAPVLERLRTLNIPYTLMCTYQQGPDITAHLQEAGLTVGIHLRSPQASSLKRVGQVPGWLTGVLQSAYQQRRTIRDRLRADGSRPLFVVHGDTMTAVVGAIIGRALGASVAHIEAGLRSGSIRHPFPEELDRRIVGQLANVHYAPWPDAAANLQRVRGRVVVTHGNTVTDAVRHAALDGENDSVASSDFSGIVLLHRSEFLHNADLVKDTLRELAVISKEATLTIVLDSLAQSKMGDIVSSMQWEGPTQIVGKIPHRDFVSRLQSADFVVTDSGGVQEECYALGVPCLIHRMRTERSEGLGSTAMLSGWDAKAISQFVVDVRAGVIHRGGAGDEGSPSAVIVDDLIRYGFARA